MPILKAGELATSIFPRKVSVFLPAFAAIEANAFRLGLSATDAIVKFASERTAEEMIKSGQFDSEYICKWKKDYPNADNPKALAELKTQKQILKLCRQTFRGWNFINLTKQHDENDAKYQEFLFDKAKKFLGFE